MNVGEKMKGRCITLSLALCFASAAIAQTDTKQGLNDMSIEDLMKIKVTSASKKVQALDTAPAAVTVITQSDIHRSGARTIVEALRLVPGGVRISLAVRIKAGQVTLLLGDEAKLKAERSKRRSYEDRAAGAFRCVATGRARC